MLNYPILPSAALACSPSQPGATLFAPAGELLLALNTNKEGNNIFDATIVDDTPTDFSHYVDPSNLEDSPSAPSTPTADLTPVPSAKAIDNVIECRTNVGNTDKNADYKYALPGNPPSSYGSTYLKVGIHTEDMDSIVDFFKGFNELSIDKANLSTTMHGYTWIGINSSVARVPVYWTTKAGAHEGSIVEVQRGFKTNIIGMAHFRAKLLRTVPQGTNSVSPPYKLSFPLTLFQLLGATQIKPSAIGPVTSAAAIVRAPIISDKATLMHYVISRHLDWLVKV
ncbi:hypothetical protein BC830DRAFT_1234055 [Chytriomyces sp. MP71]|nr:hypothetical protein BC830DRAFT_1234055 [Chytriomyces sp. MP71]